MRPEYLRLLYHLEESKAALESWRQRHGFKHNANMAERLDSIEERLEDILYDTHWLRDFL